MKPTFPRGGLVSTVSIYIEKTEPAFRDESLHYFELSQNGYGNERVHLHYRYLTS